MGTSVIYTFIKLRTMQVPPARKMSGGRRIGSRRGSKVLTPVEMVSLIVADPVDGFHNQGDEQSTEHKNSFKNPQHMYKNQHSKRNNMANRPAQMPIRLNQPKGGFKSGS